MQDSHLSTVHASEGHAKQLAHAFQVSLARMYEILSKDNPEPKFKRLVREISLVNPHSIAEIKADFGAFCDSLIERLPSARPHIAELHRECSEAVQARLEQKPLRTQRNETLQAIAKLQSDLRCINRELEIENFSTDGKAEFEARAM